MGKNMKNIKQIELKRNWEDTDDMYHYDGMLWQTIGMSKVNWKLDSTPHDSGETLIIDYDFVEKYMTLLRMAGFKSESDKQLL